jgi:hypothetical protein
MYVGKGTKGLLWLMAFFLLKSRNKQFKHTVKSVIFVQCINFTIGYDAEIISENVILIQLQNIR